MDSIKGRREQKQRYCARTSFLTDLLTRVRTAGKSKERKYVFLLASI